MATSFFSLLTICGLGELQGHATSGVTHVLSIIDPDLAEPDFSGYSLRQRVVLRFDDIIEPEPGKILPSADDVAAILAFGRSLGDGTEAEGHLLVHCHAGVSRSTAAMAMILAQANQDVPEQALIDRLTAIRPQAWPNLRMITFADEQLDRQGRLIAAVAQLYRRRLAERPDLAIGLAQLGRSMEIDLARRTATPAA